MLTSTPDIDNTSLKLSLGDYNCTKLQLKLTRKTPEGRYLALLSSE